ncbi:MAG: glycosyl hydrolase [Armatimonadia bacterium]
MDYFGLTEGFADPAAAYRPMLFWIWNGKLDREEIARQVADFAAKGAGGFFIHPMGENFRLGDFVEGITPPYLSDEYFEFVRYAVELAEEHGLYAWLYDEGGWPSGTAQGKVTEGHPEFRGRRLHAVRLDCGDTSTCEGELVAAVGLPEMGVPVPLDPKELAQGLCPYDEVIAFTLVPDGFPVDILNPDAVRRFVEVTHEKYVEVVGDYFGTTIPGMFTDETPLGGGIGGEAIPWTRQFLQMLTARMGRDARIYLPLLFSPEAVGPHVVERYSEHELLAARCEYYNCLTDRFGQAYWQQITEWCGEHGLIHTGHVGGEDNLPDHVSFGHFFRTAGQLHAPGVDSIWRQIFPGKANFPFPRLAASAAKRKEQVLPEPWRGLAITETNAVYGAGLTYEQARWVADYQFQSGINLYGQMAYCYTTQGGRVFGTISHFGEGSPQWPYYGGFADYVGRMSMLVRNSAEAAPVAIYYPAEALWTREGVAAAWETTETAALTLTEMQVAFDFIDGDLLSRICGAGVGGAGCNLSYQAVIVPRSLAISAAALEELAEFAEAGGRLVMLGQWPVQPAEMQGLEQFERAMERLGQAGVKPVEADDLETALEGLKLRDPWLKLLDPLPDLLMSVREVEGAKLYLLTNNSDKTLEPFFGFRPTAPDRGLVTAPTGTVAGASGRAAGDGRAQGSAPTSDSTGMVLEAWDLRDGERSVLAEAEAGEAHEVTLMLPPWGTQVLVARPVLDTGETPVLRRGEEATEELGTPESHEFMRWLANPEHRSSRVPHADVLVEFESADEARVVRQHVLMDGTIEYVVEEDLPQVFPGMPAPLKLWEEWPLVDFSGEVEYVFRFPVAEELAGEPLLLDLGKVYWAARVVLNGKMVAVAIWAPYAVDLTGQVAAGDNELRITVANTLANQFCSENVIEEAKAKGWFNPYYQRTLPMMEEDLRGGLVGPVRVLVGRIRRG